MKMAQVALLGAVLAASCCRPLQARVRPSAQGEAVKTPLVEPARPSPDGANWKSLEAVREFLRAYRLDNKVLPERELAETDWKQLLSLLEESSSESVGRFLGRAARRPGWVTSEILARFNRAVSVNLGLNFKPPGPIPELFYVRVGCVEFFLGPEGRVADAYYGLYILAERQSTGVEDPKVRSSTLFRAIARVGREDPAPMLGILSSPTENQEMRAGILQAITSTRGEWEAHRQLVLDALLSRVRQDDDRIVDYAVQAIAENKWLDSSSEGVIRERYNAMAEGIHRASVRRWLETVERK